LRGGPEDGRELDVPADPSGQPVPRITVPVRAEPNRPFTGPPPLLVYERAHAHADVWDFTYVGAESQS